MASLSVTGFLATSEKDGFGVIPVLFSGAVHEGMPAERRREVLHQLKEEATASHRKAVGKAGLALEKGGGWKGFAWFLGRSSMGDGKEIFIPVDGVLWREGRVGEFRDFFDSFACGWDLPGGFSEPAVGVFYGRVDDAGANRIEVDVLSHAEQGGATAFDDDGFEFFGPEGAETAMGLIKPNREAQFEDFHKHGNVVHALEEELAGLVCFRIVCPEPLFEHFRLVGAVFGGAGEEDTVAAEEFVVGNGGEVGRRDTAKDVDVV